MSQQDYPPQPPAGWTPQPQHAAPPTAPRKPKRWPWIVAIVAAAGIGFGAGNAGGSEPTVTAEPTATTTASPPAAAPSTPKAKPVEAPKPPPEPTYATPKPADFKLAVKQLSKQCFGSAGCNITYRIVVTYLGKAKLDPSKTYEVTYDVRGGEDPQTNTLTIAGTESTVDKEEFISTTSKRKVLTAVVTDVA